MRGKMYKYGTNLITLNTEQELTIKINFVIDFNFLVHVTCIYFLLDSVYQCFVYIFIFIFLLKRLYYEFKID